MLTDTTIVGLEILVPDLDDALVFFSDTLGLKVAHIGPSPDVTAKVAVLDGGSIAITLIQPLESDGPAFPDPTPRLSQFVVSVSELDQATSAIAEAGLAVQVVDDSSAFVLPAAMEGVVGFPMALVFRQSDLYEVEEKLEADT